MSDNAPRITEMEQRLHQALHPESLEIIDDSAAHAGHAGARGGAGHFQVIIVSNTFAGLSRIARHRMVYDVLKPMMPNHIHALSIKALTPEEW